MTDTPLSEVLRRSSATMVYGGDDVTGALSTLLVSAVDALGAAAGGILVRGDGGRVELLTATSHRATDLELAQLQSEEGPCLEAIDTGRLVAEQGARAIAARWPSTGAVIVSAGYRAVHAAPMVWHGRTFGGLNLFWDIETGPPDDGPDSLAVADAATLLILSKGPLPEHVLSDSLAKALADRAVVEQAKGALAYVRSLDAAAAYDALVRLAEEDVTTLGEAAHAVLERARLGTLA